MVLFSTDEPNILEKHCQLNLKFQCNSQGQTVITHQYETHPMRVSSPFRLEPDNNCRGYVYLRNNSPGLFAKDRLNIVLDVNDNTQLYLTEQSATKVHPMKHQEVAEVNYQWRIAPEAMVEFVPEPVILYSESKLKQQTQIAIHSTASLFWSDVILPGRLARGESYQFQSYNHVLAVYSDRGELWFLDRMHLTGKDNLFCHNNLFASLPVLGNAIAITPQIEIDLLKKNLDRLSKEKFSSLVAATSVLPHNKGILIRVLASQSQHIKSYWSFVINFIRKLNHQLPLPQIPK